MGTDIHMFAEVRRDGRWVPALPEMTCPWHPTDERECYWCKGTKVVHTYDGRNYNLFGILGNVRNGRGFAGCLTGDGWPSISDCRGVPEDSEMGQRLLSRPWGDSDDTDSYTEAFESEVGSLCGTTWLGDHRYSWCTLREILDFDWGHSVTQSGHVTLADVPPPGERPKDWSGGVRGDRVRNVPIYALRLLKSLQGRAAIEQADRLALKSLGVEWSDIDAWQRDPGSRCWVAVMDWKETARDAVGQMWWAYVEALKKLGSPDDVRVIFGFDS